MAKKAPSKVEKKKEENKIDDSLMKQAAEKKSTTRKVNQLTNDPSVATNSMIKSISAIDVLEKINPVKTEYNNVRELINKGSLSSVQAVINASRQLIDYANPLSQFSSSHSISNFDKSLDLENEIYVLKKKLSDALKNIDKVNSEKSIEIEEIKKEIRSKESINHIVPRICEEAREKLFTDEKFKDLFKNESSCNAVVVSIDIRRSTELMLKAREPKLFSKFITQLSELLKNNIIENYGVFDKFTGDGILAFFPKFYSGEDAMLRAIKSARECHDIFDKYYNDSRDCFNIFIKDVGLGIGIDYGSVTLVNNGNELTVVGIPVVYACRMSGAKAGDTLLNQPAKEEIERLYENSIKIIETEIDIKNEGQALAYKVEILINVENIDKPDWTKGDVSDHNNDVEE